MVPDGSRRKYAGGNFQPISGKSAIGNLSCGKGYIASPAGRTAAKAAPSGPEANAAETGAGTAPVCQRQPACHRRGSPSGGARRRCPGFAGHRLQHAAPVHGGRVVAIGHGGRFPQLFRHKHPAITTTSTARKMAAWWISRAPQFGWPACPLHRTAQAWNVSK